MANRNTLHINHLEEFTEWLKKDGWELQDTKGEYEVLRARKPGKKHPLIVYKKAGAKEHLTVRGTDWTVVRAFFKEKEYKDSKCSTCAYELECLILPGRFPECIYTKKQEPKKHGVPVAEIPRENMELVRDRMEEIVQSGGDTKYLPKIIEAIDRRKGGRKNPYPYLLDHQLDGRVEGEVIYCRNATLKAMKEANRRKVELRWREEDF